MPDEPTIADTADLSVTEYDAARQARLRRETGAGSNAPPPPRDGTPEVGLAQKGDGEDAVVRRETEI